ncbi:4547_t:CDS:2, partial [Acaulospora colombiana]
NYEDSPGENEMQTIQIDTNEEKPLDERSQRRKGLADLATANYHVGTHSKCIRPTEDIFNPEDPKIREDIVRMIIQYLSDEGYTVSKMTIYDEANVKWNEREERVVEVKRLKKAVFDGDWAEVDKLCAKSLVKNHKSFLYAVYKQQYLEHIENQEIQKAFSFLNKRLKPLEHLQMTPNEFKDLCYLLTAKGVRDAPSFRNWEGIGPARLLQDYSSFVIPNAVRATLTGHRGNVKCVGFIGEEGRKIVSGSR